MELVLENGFKVYVEVEDKELDFTLIDTTTTENAYAFQTMLTKKDAKKIARVLDSWVSGLI
jgi:hypothetical protein